MKLQQISFWYSLVRLKTGQKFSFEFIDYHEKYLAGIFKSLFCIELAYVVIGRPGFDPWVGKIPLEESMAIHSSILAWRIPMDRGAWWATVHSVAESDLTE